MQSLVHIVQVMGGPLLHTMHRDLLRNRQLVQQLIRYKAELIGNGDIV